MLPVLFGTEVREGYCAVVSLFCDTEVICDIIQITNLSQSYCTGGCGTGIN